MSLASMTGFGRAQGELSDRMRVSVVTRSVNHRFLDVVVRTNLREELPEAEAVVRASVSEAVHRGRVTVQLTLEVTASREADVLVSAAAVRSTLQQLREIELEDGASTSTLGLRDVLVVPGLVSLAAERTELDEGELEALGTLVGDAVLGMQRMRAEEGVRLGRHVAREIARLREFLSWIEPRLPGFREQVLDRLRLRVDELLGPDSTVDPDRLAQEAAMLADRSDVVEEVVRLHSHLEQLEQRLGQGGVVGRALDFLCQEVHRELNTLGSKCREPGVADHLVEAKTAAERIREQVQNLE
jgi:uncharacterized protein (TIGR00255 family)